MKQTCCVIEDNLANAHLLEDMLGYLGYESIVFQNGNEALIYLESQMVDFILLDLSLPGMNGFMVNQKIREFEHCQKIPTIAVTAMAMPAQIKQIEDAGFTGYIAKPIQLDGLRRILDTCSNTNSKEKMIV